MIRRIAALATCLISTSVAVHSGAQPLERKGDKLYYCGNPIRLVGYGDYGMLAESSFDYQKFFDTVAEDYQVNMVRVWVNYHFAHDLTPFAGPWKKWDLTQFNQAFFDRLKAFVSYARSKGVMVQVTLFDSCGLESGAEDKWKNRWVNNPYNAANNAQPYCQKAGEFDDVGSDLWEKSHKPLMKKVVDTLNGLDNVIWEVMNEPHPGYGDKAFNKAVIDYLHGLLHADGFTGSRVISVNDPYNLIDDPKVDVVAFHVTDLAKVGSYGGVKKPVIVSNDGDASQTAKTLGKGPRTDRVLAFCKGAWGDGSPLGHTHCEILDKDIMCDTWGTQDYTPQVKCISKSVLGVLAPFSKAYPQACGLPEDPKCPIGKKVMVDNTADGAPKGGYSETTKNWATWESQGYAIGFTYRYLSKGAGDGSKKGTAKWVPSLPVAGNWLVQATYRATGNRTNDADYFVTDAKGGVAHIQVDQTDGCSGECGHGPVYAKLGTYWLEPGKGFVEIKGDDGKSDEADAMIWTLKNCGTVAPPDCGEQGEGCANGCCPGLTCQGGQCLPPPVQCGGQGQGCASGCCPGLTCQGGLCEPPPVDSCPGGGPGPQTRTFHAKAVTSGGDWTNAGYAKGEADGKLATTPNLDKGEDLVGSGFDACDPPGGEQVMKVVAGVRSKVQYSSGKYAIVLALSAGGQAKKTFATESLLWQDLDVTADKGAWSWDDVKALKVRLALEDHPGGYKDSDVWVDAFRVAVTWQPCGFPGPKACDGLSVTALDACGKPAGVVESCDDGNPCTIDSCDPAGPSCGHAPSGGQECTCKPQESKACQGQVLVWLDSCANVTGIAENCNDENPCTEDGCDPATAACTHEPVAGPGCACSPETKKGCVGARLFWFDSCGSQGPLADPCDDGDPCTDDGCDTAGGECTHVQSALPECDPCSSGKTAQCDGGKLAWVDACGTVGDVAEDCDDKDSCTTDGCAEEAAACWHVPVKGEGCAPCTPSTKKECLGSGIVVVDSCGHPGALVTPCTDGDPCTEDSCDPATGGCVHTPSLAAECSPCVPGVKTACDGMEIAWVDSCGVQGGVLATCDDGDPCTVDGCVPATALCVHAKSDSPLCQGWPSEEKCPGDAKPACDGGDVVWMDGCGRPAGLKQACTDMDPCTVDGCDEAAVACTHAKAPTAECGGEVPDDPCGQTATLVCQGGDVAWVDACGRPLGLARICDDGDPCTRDSCDEETVECAFVPIEKCAVIPDGIGPDGKGGAGGGCASRRGGGMTGSMVLVGVVMLMIALARRVFVHVHVHVHDHGLSLVISSVVLLLLASAASAGVPTCPDPGPGTHQQVKYSSLVPIVYGWNYEAEAEGKPDGKFSQCPADFNGNDLVATKFMVCDPGGDEVIEGVKVAVYSKMQYDSGPDKVTAKLSAGGAAKVSLSHTELKWDEVDVTADKAWNWQSITDLKAHYALDSHPGDTWVDAFRVTVTYTTCAPDAVTKCEGGGLVWYDSCGKQGGPAGSCDDGNPCTVDGCEGGACTHVPSGAPECTCAPAHAKLACTNNQLWWLDGCGKQGDLVETCTDADPCTIDGCNAGACFHQFVAGLGCCEPNASAKCAEDKVIWVDGCGVAGEVKEDCDDKDPCTLDSCDTGQATCLHASMNDKPGCGCEDKKTAACVQGQIVLVDACGNAGEVVNDCLDGNPCTSDGCDGEQCTHAQAGSAKECGDCIPEAAVRCVKGNVVWLDSCDSAGEVAVSCDDGDECTLDGCDDKSRSCFHLKSQAAACASAPDPMACQGAVTYACADGHVVWRDSCGKPAGIAAVCTDQDPCTDDGCAGGMCLSKPIDHPECKGKACTGSKVEKACRDGARVWLDECGHVASVEQVCVDGDPCTIDGCDQAAWECTFEPVGKGCEPGIGSDAAAWDIEVTDWDAAIENVGGGKSGGGCAAEHAGKSVLTTIVAMLLLIVGTSVSAHARAMTLFRRFFPSRTRRIIARGA